MNLDQAILEEIYNNLCRHLPNKYRETSLDPNGPFKKIITNQFNSIYLHKYTATIQIVTPRVHAFVIIDDDIINLDGTIITKNTTTMETSLQYTTTTPTTRFAIKYELANPSTNIYEIIQTILNFINIT